MSKIKFFLLIIFTVVPTATYAQKAQTPANVNVINTPDNPVAVRQVGEQRQLFQVGGVILWQCNLGLAERSFQVPAGKRFVIESVSFRNVTLIDPGDGVRAELTTTFEGIPRSRPLDFRQQLFGQQGVFIATHPLLAYADGGTEVTVHAFLSNSIGMNCSPPEVVIRGFITGYLIDMPQ